MTQRCISACEFEGRAVANGRQISVPGSRIDPRQYRHQSPTPDLIIELITAHGAQNPAATRDPSIGDKHLADLFTHDRKGAGLLTSAQAPRTNCASEVGVFIGG